MEYKTVGGGLSPADDFTAQLNEFCGLDAVQREALAVWFETTTDFDVYGQQLPPNIVASTLLPEQFRKAAGPIRQLLSAWHHRALQIEDIERDLLLFGLSSERVSLVTDFLRRLAAIKERVWLDGIEGTAQFAGLPTVDDINIIWDARAIFAGENYYYFGDDTDEPKYRECLGLTCLAIVEFMTSDAGGKKERASLQMSEASFKSFLRAVNRASEQLVSLKKLIKPLAVAPGRTED